MRSGLYSITTFIFLLVVSATTFTFIDQLPACWQTCIEKRGSQCDSTDLNCLCHSAANPALLPILLTCVRKTCDTKYYPEFLTAPLQAIQTACSGTAYKISDAAVSKADGAAESAYSAVLGAAGRGGGSATRTRTRVTKSWDMGTTIYSSVSIGASKTGRQMTSSVATSTPPSSPVVSIGPMTGASTVSGPFARSSASSAPSTSTSTSTSLAHESSGSGGTPLDVGQQGAGVEKQAGSLFRLAIAVVVALFF